MTAPGRRHPIPNQPHPPVLLLALAVAFSLLGDVTLYVVLPIRYTSLGFSAIQVGVLLSANRWVRLLSNHFVERVLRRYKSESVLAVALVAGSAATLTYAVAPPFPVFLAARLCWGVSWSFIRHIGVMTSVARVGHEKAGGIVGLYNGVVQIGFIGGTMLGALMLDLAGYSAAFMLMAVLSLCAVGFDYGAFALIRRGLAHGAGRPQGLQRQPGEKPPAPPSPYTPGWAASRLLYIRGFIVSCVGTGLIISTLGFVLQSRYGETVRIGSAQMGVVTLNGIVIAGHYLIQSIGSPALGRYADAVGRVRAETTAFVVGAGALLPALFINAYSILVPLVLLFFVATVAAKLALVARAGVQGARSFARFMTAVDLGAATGPVIGWLAISFVGNATAVFAIGTSLYAIAALASLLTPLTQLTHSPDS